MVDEVYTFQLTIPGGTPQAAPATFDVSFPPRVVDRVEVRVPVGPKGQVGFWVGASGVPVVPQQPGQWIVTDGETVGWDLVGKHTSGSWQVTAYNLGRYAHTIYPRFSVRLPPSPGPSAIQALIPSSALTLTI